MSVLTQPLGLKRFLTSKPKGGIDLLPFFDAVLIVLIIALNSSRFVAAPGATVNLSRVGSELSAVATPNAVLTVGKNDLYFFQGQKLLSGSLKSSMVEFVEKENGENSVLLIKADQALNTANLFELFEMAKSAGFERVHLAAENNHRDGLDPDWESN